MKTSRFSTIEFPTVYSVYFWNNGKTKGNFQVPWRHTSWTQSQSQIRIRLRQGFCNVFLKRLWMGRWPLLHGLWTFDPWRNKCHLWRKTCRHSKLLFLLRNHSKTESDNFLHKSHSCLSNSKRGPGTGKNLKIRLELFEGNRSGRRKDWCLHLWVP